MVAEMVLGEIALGEIALGEIALGEIALGEIALGETAFGEIAFRRSVATPSPTTIIFWLKLWNFKVQNCIECMFPIGDEIESANKGDFVIKWVHFVGE